MSESKAKTRLELLEAFGRRLRTARTIRGMGLYTLATASGVPARTVVAWEVGSPVDGYPTAAQAEKLSAALKAGPELSLGLEAMYDGVPECVGEAPPCPRQPSYSPGPWTVERAGKHVSMCDLDGKPVLCPCGKCDVVLSGADARLIEMAPMLADLGRAHVEAVLAIRPTLPPEALADADADITLWSGILGYVEDGDHGALAESIVRYKALRAQAENRKAVR